VHDDYERTVQDLCCGEVKVYRRLRQRRFFCPRCMSCPRSKSRNGRRCESRILSCKAACIWPAVSTAGIA
jgi:hypothetical protein